MKLLLLCSFVVLFATGCTMPRVIVLNDPLDARQHNDLGAAYEASGEADLALREYQRAADLDPEWDLPLFNLGNVHAACQAWQKAETSYRAALKRNPGNGESMNNLAWVLLQQGDRESARQWALRAVEAFPDTPAFQETLATIEESFGDETETPAGRD